MHQEKNSNIYLTKRTLYLLLYMESGELTSLRLANIIRILASLRFVNINRISAGLRLYFISLLSLVTLATS